MFLKERNYALPSDIYSLGVLLFVMYMNKNPFEGETPEKIIYKIRKGNFIFDAEWCDPKIKVLIEEMIDKNFENRPTINEILDRVEEILREMKAE